MMIALWLALGLAHASPTIDSLNVQGFLKKADNTAVTDGTYTMAFGVFQNGVMLWGKSYPVAITGGLLSQTLSGNGANLSALPAATGMNADYSAANLQASLLVAGGAGAVSVRVYAVSVIDSSNPQFDVPAAAVPTSFLAELTKGVIPGSITTAGLAATAKTDTSAGAGDAGKLVLLDNSGLIAINMIPPLPATSIGSGQVGLTHGGTGSTDGSITGSGAIAYMSAPGFATTVGNSAGASSLVLQSGTGGVVVSPGSTSGTVTVGNNASTGNSVFGNGGGASATVIQSGTGGVLLSPAGGGVVRVTNGAGLNLVRGTGSVTINSANNPTSYTLTLPATSGTAGQYLQTDGSGTTTWIKPSLTSLGAAASGANTDITGLNPGGVLALGGAATTALTVLPAGNVTMNPTGTISVGGASTTGVSVSPAGNVSISPSTGGVTFNPSGALSLGGVLTTAVTLSPGGTVSIAPSGTLTLGGLSNSVNNGLTLNGATSGALTLKPAATTASHTLTLPANQGAAGALLRNDGTGVLTWITPGTSGYAASGANTDINSLDPAGPLALGVSNATNITITPTGTLTAGGSSVSASTFGNNGANSVATFRGGASGASAQAILTSGGSGTGAVTLDANATGGGVNVTANTTGAITLTQGSTSGVMTLGSTTSTGGVTVRGAGTTTITSSKAAAGAVTISASASAGGIAITPGATGAVTVGNTSTGATTIGNTGAASATTIQSGSTGKIKLQASGSTGVAFTSMGVCSVASFFAVAGSNARACANLPASVAVSCSPNGNQGATATWSAWASAAGTVTIVMSENGAATTWTCMWVQP